MATVHSVSIKANLDAKQAQQEAEKLHKTIKATKADAASMHTSSGGRDSLNAAKKAQATPGSELTQYGNTRAMRPGGTGASARDFAQEAQGLGGLVRLYATYAANVFAVAAAFNALQAAQDTTNMVKGLNQLGAASGVALGSLQKELVKAMDGAVSLREAMEATVKASSSGMSNKDILRMGEAAKKAQQALGINMPDALSRISRGITKLEPELLDELGIFTRIDPAVQAYAKSVNKSVSSLTQFERQQAFSNAVLKEAEDKFREISIETNAYTQLLAQLKDTATVLGSALNTVLVPVISTLSNNTTAFYTILAGLGFMLLKQAIPAFGQFNKSLKETQRLAAEASSDRMSSLTKELDSIKNKAAVAAKEIYKTNLAAADQAAGAAVDKFDRAEAELKIAKAGKDSNSQAAIVTQIRNISNLTELTKEQVVALEKYANSLKKTGGNTESIKEFAKVTREVYDTHEAYTKKLEEQAKAEEAHGVAAANRAKSSINYKITERQFLNEQATLERNRITALAGESVMIKGWSATWKEIGENVDRAVGEKKLTSIQGGFTKAAAGFSMLTGMVSGAVSAFGIWAEVLGISILALGAIDSWADKAAPKVTEFKDSLEKLKGTTDTYVSTVDRLAKVNVVELFSTKTLQAQAAAMINAADAFEEAGKKAEEAQKAISRSVYSSFMDYMSSTRIGQKSRSQELFQEKAGESAAKIMQSLKGAPVLLEKTRKEVAALLNVTDPSNPEQMIAAFAKISPQSEEYKKFNAIMQQAGITLGNIASTTKSLDDALTKAGDSYTSFVNQYADKTPFSVFLVDSISAIGKVQDAISGSGGFVQSVTSMLSAIDRLSKTPILSSSNTELITKDKKELESLREEYKKLFDERHSLLGKASTTLETDAFGNVSEVSNNTKAEIDRLISVNKQLQDIEKKIAPITTRMQQALQQGQEKIYQALEAGMGAALAKVGQVFRGAVISAFGNLPGAPSMKADTQLSDIKYQETMLNLQLEMLAQQTLIAFNTQKQNEIAAAEHTAKTASTPQLREAALATLNEKYESSKTNNLQAKDLKDPKAILAMQKERNGDDQLKLISYAQSILGITTQLKSLKDQAAGVVFTKQIEELTADLALRKSILDTQKNTNNSKIEEFELQEKQSGSTTKELILSKSILEMKNIELNMDKEILELSSKVATLQLAQSTAEKSGIINPSAKKQSDLEIARLLEEIETSKRKKSTAQSNLEYATNLKILGIAKKTFEFEQAKSDIMEQTKKTLESTKLNTYETSISNQKDYVVDTGAQDLQLQSLKDTEAFRARAADIELAKRKEIFDLQQRQAAITNKDSTEYTRLTEIISLTNQKYAAITAGETASKAASDSRLLVQQDILNTTREQAAATRSVQEASESLAVVFGSIGEAAGGLLTTLYDVAKGNEANEVSVRKAGEAANTAKEQFGANSKEYIAAKKDESLAIKKSTKDELAGNLAVLSSAKKMFSEKTAMHKGLGVIEKIMHIQRLALMAADLGATIANTATKIGILSPAIMAQFLATIPPPFGWALGAAAVAAIGGMMSGGGGGFTASAAQMQETQGTGQSYDSGGTLIANGGGVLGDITAKNQDINNSIDRLSNLTIDGNIIGIDMVTALEKIKYNTQQMAAGFFKVQGLTGGLSGFGTVEKSSPGILGAFASSTSIIDTGIKFMAGKFQQYETVQKTNSGLFGLGKSTRTGDNLQSLPASLEDDINQLFADNVKMQAKALGDLVGLDSKKLESQLTNAISKEGFKVSLKDLKGEEVSDALMQVISETIGLPLREMAPFLDNFRQIGEGTVGTLIRLKAETGFVDKAFRAMGNPLRMLPKIATQATQEQIDAAKVAADKVISITQKLEDLKKANIGSFYGGEYDQGYTNTGLITEAEKELTLAKLAATEATRGLRLAETTNIQANIELTQSMIDSAGGIDKFAQQMDFFQTNFVNSMQTFKFGFEDLNESLAEISATHSIVGLQATTSREQFTELVQGLDLTTVAGRETYQALMEIAPAVDQFQSKVEEFAGTMADAFFEAMEANQQPAEAGAYVAETISYSIQKTIYDQGVNAIMGVIANQIVSPIIAGAMAGATATEIIGRMQIESIKAQVTTIANTLATLFKDPQFKALITSMTQAVSGLVTTTASILPTLPAKPTIDKVKDQAKEAAEELAKVVEKLKDLAKASVTSLFDSLTQTLKRNADAIKANISKVKDFIKSITEFKTNLLLGDKSTLTPAEKYLKARTEFNATYAKALTGDQASIDKLQSTSDAFLTASQQFYASGTQYVADFQTVMSSLDTASTAAADLQTRLEEELRTANDHLTYLDSMDTTLEDILAVLEIGLSKTQDQLLEYMSKAGVQSLTAQGLVASGIASTIRQATMLIDAIDNVPGNTRDGQVSITELTRARNNGATTASQFNAINQPGTLSTSRAVSDIGATYGYDRIASAGNLQVIGSQQGAFGYTDAQGAWQVQLKNGTAFSKAELQTLLQVEGAKFLPDQPEALRNILVNNGLSQAVIAGILDVDRSVITDWADANNLPAFAAGTNYVPYDMPAYIHEGERIFPKADNEELMKSIKGNNNAELIAEIRILNNKVASLERTVAQGAAVNAQATDRNTQAVVGAVSDSTNRSILATRVREKAQIV